MDSLAEKDALMREIHHRVKNNLQIITSLLNMQQRALTDPAAKAAMNDTRQRITALAQIYRALYQGPDLKRVDLRPFLEELTAQLLAGDMSTSGAVRTEVHADPLVIDPDRLAPIALFAVEAITNAQKHALRARRHAVGDFFVRGEEAELSIGDDGPARPGPRRRRRPHPDDRLRAPAARQGDCSKPRRRRPVGEPWCFRRHKRHRDPHRNLASPDTFKCSRDRLSGPNITGEDHAQAHSSWPLSPPAFPSPPATPSKAPARTSRRPARPSATPPRTPSSPYF
jgi:two-component sensor histidine kinase